VVVLDGTNFDVIVKGGQRFHEATRVRLEGATAGGSLLKIGWIGLGLRVEVSVDGRRIVTSPVQWITMEGVPPLDLRREVRQPRRIVHIALAPRNRADVRGIGQQKLDRRLEHVLHRLPVHARGLEHHDATPVFGQPVG
jgi:hypothetical protein